jgi:hypothetical protein
MPDLREPLAPLTSNHRTPIEVDSFRPSAARMYDYYLGGTHHLGADREAADALLAAVPSVAGIARANRSFLGRAVRYAAAQGVDQFLDLGAGFPLVGGVPEVALAANPQARVVAVDIDPGVVARTQAAISDEGLTYQVGAVHADLCDAVGVLRHPVTRRLLDLDRPVAILCLSVLHFIGGDLLRVLGPLRKAVPAGSLLALSHASGVAGPAPRNDGLDPDTIIRLIYDCTLTPLSLRSHGELSSLLAGLALAEPGLVPVDQWRPSPQAPAAGGGTLLGAVAHLRG